MFKVFCCVFVFSLSMTAESQSAAVQKKAQKSHVKVNCNVESRCYKLHSCAEAMAYFHKCGHVNLDGDNDGIPCEALCR